MSSEKEQEENQIELNPKKRLFIFITLVTIATISSFDGGIIPQATTTLTKDWNTKDLTVGYFGASDYIGRVFGSLILAYIINIYNRKKLLIFSLFFKGILLSLSIIFKNFIINIIARGFSGISQVFFTSYFPVWADQFAIKESKSLWVMLVQIGNPLGIIMGYGLSTVLSLFGFGYDEEEKVLYFGEWRIAFLIEGVFLIIIGILCIFFENVYFDKNFVLIGKNYGKIEKEEKKFLFFRNFCKIIKNPLYLFTTLATAILYFGLEILQFWGNNYLKEYKDIKNKSKLFLFNVICVSGPTIGVATGGIITSKLGGYSKKKTIFFCVILSIFCSLSGLLISEVPKENNLIIFCLVVWLFYLFLGGMIPPEAGIIIASLDKELKGDGFTVTNFICNLIGAVPSPFAFPFFKDVVFKNDEKKQWPKAMFVCMLINCLNTVFIVVATGFRMRLPDDLDQKSELLITNIIDSNEDENENS